MGKGVQLKSGVETRSAFRHCTSGVPNGLGVRLCGSRPHCGGGGAPAAHPGDAARRGDGGGGTAARQVLLHRACGGDPRAHGRGRQRRRGGTGRHGAGCKDTCRHCALFAMGATHCSADWRRPCGRGRGRSGLSPVRQGGVRCACRGCQVCRCTGGVGRNHVRWGRRLQQELPCGQYQARNSRLCASQRRVRGQGQGFLGPLVHGRPRCRSGFTNSVGLSCAFISPR
mmetsp:Transcript_106551/g.299411  ORF Transcript_106551/g.299411 Transcript_106551/m.299411 type:complete len:227 (+) Transcript_106551:214-894(+)